METLLKGFIIGGSLIVAIGAQNAFVLKQGLLKQHVFGVALTCFLCDALLMTLGVFGVGSLINASRVLMLMLATLGFLFLVGYGARSFYSAFRSQQALTAETSLQKEVGLQRTLLATLTITLLNPHVYLDTVMIVGGVSAPLPVADKALFLSTLR